MRKAYIYIKSHLWLQIIIFVVAAVTLVCNIYSYRLYKVSDLKVLKAVATDVNLNDESDFMYVTFSAGDKSFYCNVNANYVAQMLKEKCADKTLTIYYTERKELTVFGQFLQWSTKVIAIECEGNEILSVEETNNSNVFRFVVGAVISGITFVIWIIAAISYVKALRKRRNVSRVELVEIGNNESVMVVRRLNPKLYTKVENSLYTMKKAATVIDGGPFKGIMVIYNNGDYEIQTFCYKKIYEYTDTGFLEQEEKSSYDRAQFDWMCEKLSYSPEWYGSE